MLNSHFEYFRWDWISDTNDMPDEEVNQRICETALYHTLEVVSERKG